MRRRKQNPTFYEEEEEHTYNKERMKTKKKKKQKRLQYLTLLSFTSTESYPGSVYRRGFTAPTLLHEGHGK